MGAPPQLQAGRARLRGSGRAGDFRPGAWGKGMAQLFQNFEINRVPRWPLMTRLLAASVVAHGLLLVAVVYVPTLQSMLRVAGGFVGIEFVDEDYDRALVGQRAQIVTLDPYRKLYYPPGYFATDAPPAPDATALFQPVVAPPPPVVRYTRPPRPRVVRAQPTPLPTPAPTPSPEVAQAQASPTPAASPTPDDAKQSEEAKRNEAEIDKLAAENGTPRPPSVNTRPFKDIAARGKELFDAGKIDLKSTIEATVEAERNEDGTLKRETVKIEGLASSESMSQLAQEFVNALSESKVLVVLQGAQHVKMSLRLDEQKVAVRVMSEVESAEEAAKMAKGYSGMLFFARKSKEGTEEGELYKNLQLSSEGNQFVITFEMPREAAGKMIAEMLARQKSSG